MRAIYRLAGHGPFILALVCTGCLMYNMVVIPFCKEQIFLDQGIIRIGQEMFIFIGFVLVLIFNITSLLWVSSHIRISQRRYNGNKGIFALGALCLILLVGGKVMMDEIGREYLLGWEVLGEWIILNVFLTIQLLYNALILRKMYRLYIARQMS